MAVITQIDSGAGNLSRVAAYICTSDSALIQTKWQSVYLISVYLQDSVASEDRDSSEQVYTAKDPISVDFHARELSVPGNGLWHRAGIGILQEAHAHCSADAHQRTQDLCSGALAPPLKSLKPAYI